MSLNALPHLALVLVVFAIGSDSFALAGLLPALCADLQIPLDAGGQLISVYALAYALGAPMLCIATASLDSRHTLLISCAVFASASMSTAFCHDVAPLVACRVSAALGAGLFFATASAYAVERSSPEHKTAVLAQIYAGMTWAMVVGVPLLTWLSSVSGWRTAYLLSGGCAWIAGVAMLVYLPSSRPRHVASLRERFAVAADADVLRVLCVTMFGIAGSFAVYTFLAALLPQASDSLGEQLSGMLLLFGISGLVGNRLAAVLLRRKALHLGLTTSLLGQCLAFLLLGACSLPAAVGPSDIGVLAAITLYGIAGWLFPPMQQGRLAIMVPGAVATVLSLNASFLYAGMAFGTLMGALAIRHFTLSACCWTGAAMEAVALILAFARKSVVLRNPSSA